MSLDVYLTGKTVDVPCCCSCGHEHSRPESEEYFHANITHNLNLMAVEAGIYDCVWTPDEHGITKAGQVVDPLEAGIALMKSDPARFMRLNANNGWGTYDNFLPWLERYLTACKANPEASVSVSR